LGFPGDAHSKESPANAGEARDGFDSWVGETPWKRKQQLTPAFLPGKFHGQRSLEGYSQWDCKEVDTTEYTIWPQYPPGDEEHWPEDGTLNYNTILQLELF